MEQNIKNTVKKAWSFHPRPQFKREHYYILDGEWSLNHKPIQVPYPPQSALSGYTGEVTDNLSYKTTFSIPTDFVKERILLHFDGVDQITKVKINHKPIGKNEGGYLPFSFDITEYVNREEDNILEVFVKDTLSFNYPYGKQSKNPHGMWYTEVSGIWQSVWLENVPDVYMEQIKIDTDLDSVSIQTSFNKPFLSYQVQITLPDNTIINEIYYTKNARIQIPNPIHWTPEQPYLYRIKLTTDTDCVESYFALRTIEIKKVNGIRRVCLNGKPIFLHGVLDQGYFRDGIFLPAHETEYDNDIKRMKELGFNLLRKHVKIEPDYFYYACDKLGMLVMQDMVNSGSYSFVRDTLLPNIGVNKNWNRKLSPTNKRRMIFETEVKKTIKHLYNHPCIIAYTIFNEGWGQFNSDELYDYVKKLDSTRLIDATSGWYIGKKNDFDSQHIYFRLKKLTVKERPLLISECGGYNLLIQEHFFGKKEYGYGACKDKDELTRRIEKMYHKMIIPAIKGGLCGCIYTQLSDVENESNGLYTYDRKVCKVHKHKLRKLAKEINTCLREDEML